MKNTIFADENEFKRVMTIMIGNEGNKLSKKLREIPSYKLIKKIYKATPFPIIVVSLLVSLSGMTGFSKVGSFLGPHQWLAVMGFFLFPLLLLPLVFTRP